MKKIERLKLNKLSQEELKKRELNNLRGGSGCCKCCCGYQGEGGSSTSANWSANQAAGYTSSYGDLCGCGASLPVPEGQC